VTQWRLRPRAQLDLDDIADYTFARWGAEQAERYIRGLEFAFRQLAEDGWRGRAVSDRHSSKLRHNYGSHIIIFERASGTVDIVRILHNRMDVDTRLD
jgi:toxin ParE1/3/4